MGKGRLEAFSDGVIAIIITIMVLEFKLPINPATGKAVTTLKELWPLWPIVVSYTLSFIYIGIYWNNHHHLWAVAEKVSGGILWANLHLLFWLSLIPFATDWIGESHFEYAEPVAVYGFLLLMASIAFLILAYAMIRHHGRTSVLAKALGKDMKGKISLALYVAGIATAFIHPWIGFAFYVVVAGIWLIPDRRIEDRVEA